MLLLLTFTVSSCIYDDRSDCVLDIRFVYDYNVKEADAFSSEVKEVTLYIFDSDGTLIDLREDGGDGFPASYSMQMPSLASGDYTFVALGRNRPVTNPSREFGFSNLVKGESALSDLTMLLNMEDNVCDSEIAALYNGVCEVSLRNGRQSVTVKMKKLTNRFKIMIMPYRGSGSMESENLNIRIDGDASWLDFKGDKYVQRPTVYRPFLQKSVSSESDSETEVTSAVVAELNTSRLLYDDRPTLVITHSEDGRELLRINLAWLLSLQAIDEHRRQWGNQEYLDRQDMYTLTFFVDNGLFIKSTIIVNGWVLNITDVSL